MDQSCPICMPITLTGSFDCLGALIHLRQLVRISGFTETVVPRYHADDFTTMAKDLNFSGQIWTCGTGQGPLMHLPMASTN